MRVGMQRGRRAPRVLWAGVTGLAGCRGERLEDVSGVDAVGGAAAVDRNGKIACAGEGPAEVERSGGSEQINGGR